MILTCTTTSFLRQPLSGYPDAFVAARLQPRMTKLSDGGGNDTARHTAPAYTQRRSAIAWSFSQLSVHLREELKFIYAYLELRQLMTALRLAISGRHDRAIHTLKASLWHPMFVKCFECGHDLPSIIANCGDVMAAGGWHFNFQLAEDQTEPLQSLEHQLYMSLYEQLRRKTRDPLVLNFSSALHDLYNLAQFRDRSESPPSLPGGKLAPNDFRSADQLERAIARHYGRTGREYYDAEAQLRYSFARQLRRKARQKGVRVRLLTYLWFHSEGVTSSGTPLSHTGEGA